MFLSLRRLRKRKKATENIHDVDPEKKIVIRDPRLLRGLIHAVVITRRVHATGHTYTKHGTTTTTLPPNAPRHHGTRHRSQDAAAVLRRHATIGSVRLLLLRRRGLAVRLVHVLSRNVGELGDQRPRDGAVAGVLDAREVAAGNVEKGEVVGRVAVARVVDDFFEEDEEGEDGDAGEDPFVVSEGEEGRVWTEEKGAYQRGVDGSTSIKGVSSRIDRVTLIMASLDLTLSSTTDAPSAPVVNCRYVFARIRRKP